MDHSKSKSCKKTIFIKIINTKFIEGVETFKYMGRMIDWSGYNWLVVHRNVGKAPSFETDKETPTDGGGGSISVRNVLSGIGAGSVTIWGGDLGFVGGNIKESSGGACGVSNTCYKREGQASEVQDPEKGSSGEFIQRSGNADTGEVN